jgi:hypothetical protein
MAREQWQEHQRLFRTSGLSQQEYCEQNNLNLGTFKWWRNQFLKAEPQKPGRTEGFIPLEAAGIEPVVLEIELPNGILIRVNQGITVEFLAALCTTAHAD